METKQITDSASITTFNNKSQIVNLTMPEGTPAVTAHDDGGVTISVGIWGSGCNVVYQVRFTAAHADVLGAAIITRPHR